MRQKSLFSLWLILCLPVLLICNCAVPRKEPCIKNGKNYSKIAYKIIIDDWDSCYLRGCSYAEGDCLDLAIEEFKKAIDDRTNDAGLARPYGLRFMGYFPHRELGIIYYQIGRTEEAIKELERSLQDSSSSRAKYFLNKARKTWLQENNTDISPPRIDISSPLSYPLLTNRLSLPIEGRIEDDQFVSALSINGEPIFIELSAQTFPFTHTVSLERGINHITIKAVDLVGKTTEKTLEIMVDRIGPIINFSHSSLEHALYKRRILIQGVIFDESGINNFNINGLPIEIKGGETIAEFSQWIDLSETVQKLSFWAIDRAGNKIFGTMELFPEAKSRRKFSSSFQPKQCDSIYSKSKKQDLIKIASLDLPFSPFLLAHQESHLRDKVYLETQDPNSDPFLSLKDLPKETPYNQIYLLGEIRYNKDISAINIILNKREISSKAYDSVLKRRRSKQGEEKILFLSEVIELNPGENEIVIKITNKKGKIREWTYYITRKEEEILNQKYRLCIWVLPVENSSEPELMSPFIGSKVFAELKAAFINQKRFQVLARGEELLEDILKELKYSTSEIFDEKNALRVGKMLNADTIMASSLWYYRKNGLEIKGNITDIEMAKELCAEDSYVEVDPNNPNENIAKAAKVLAIKIRNHFPLCKGNVLKKEGTKIQVNIGHQENLDVDTKLIVYREDEWDIKFLSGARVERVLNDYSVAVLSSNEKRNGVLNMFKDLFNRLSSPIFSKSYAKAYKGIEAEEGTEVREGDLVITK